MNCFKLVLKNIAITIAGCAAIAVAVVVILGSGLLTAWALGLAEGPWPCLAFSIVYMALGFGVASGIDECRRRGA
jgi:hypothetical protein